MADASPYATKYSDVHGRNYYVNTVTNESSWTEPVLVPALVPAHAPLNSSRVQKQSPEHSRPYQENTQARGSTWTGPVRRQAAAAVAAEQSPTSPAAAPHLPLVDRHGTDTEWIEKYSPEHSRRYWVNLGTQESTWADPVLDRPGRPGKAPKSNVPHVGAPTAAALTDDSVSTYADEKITVCTGPGSSPSVPDVPDVPHLPDLPDLPSGWEEAWDEVRGKSFYWNPKTRQKTWRPPREEKVTLEFGAGPLGFVLQWDEATSSTVIAKVFPNCAHCARLRVGDVVEKVGSSYYCESVVGMGCDAVTAMIEKIKRPLTIVIVPCESSGRPRRKPPPLPGRAAVFETKNDLQKLGAQWYYWWLVALGFCALSLIASLAVAGALSGVFDLNGVYNITLFAALALAMFISGLGLWCLLDLRRGWQLLFIFGIALLILTIGEAWFVIELFSDDVLPSFTENDDKLYEHLRDSYRHRLQCPDFPPSVAGLAVSNGTATNNGSGGGPDGTISNVTSICTCSREYFCACSSRDATYCVRSYFASRKQTWYFLSTSLGFIQIAVVSFSLVFALRVRDNPILLEGAYEEFTHDDNNVVDRTRNPSFARVPNVDGGHEPTEPVSSEWEKYYSQEESRPYWVNVRTQESRWTDPVSAEGEGEAGEATPNKASPFTLGVVVVCISMLLVCIVQDNGVRPLAENPLIGPSEQILIKFGAKDVRRMQGGEWWRLITSMWLHGGVIHLFLNSMGLLSLAQGLEDEYGSARVACIYVPCGVFGCAISAIFLPWQVVRHSSLVQRFVHQATSSRNLITLDSIPARVY